MCLSISNVYEMVVTMQRVIDDLKSIIKIARDYEIDAESLIDGYDYLITDIENLLKEYEREQI